mgnify:CR=1 FL=1
METNILGADMRHLKYKFLFVILFVFTASFSFAQEAWYQGKKISEIKFNGLYMISQDELETITGSYIGRSFTDDIFMEVQNRLFALDYFEDITSFFVQAASKPRLNLSRLLNKSVITNLL